MDWTCGLGTFIIEKSMWLKQNRGDFEQRILVSDVVIEDLNWWIGNIQACSSEVVKENP